LLWYCIWKEEASHIVTQQGIAQQGGSRGKGKKVIGEKSPLHPQPKAREEYAARQNVAHVCARIEAAASQNCSRAVCFTKSS
jgi:hypothetical protein